MSTRSELLDAAERIINSDGGETASGSADLDYGHELLDEWFEQHNARVAAEALEDESLRLRGKITEATEARDSFDRGTEPWADFSRQILAMTKSANDLMLSAARIRSDAGIGGA